MAAEPDGAVKGAVKKEEAPPHKDPIVRARRLASPADAHDELRSGFNGWSGSIATDGIYAVYAVIAANWAVHGSTDKLLGNRWAVWSLIVAIAYLAGQVFLTYWMSVLYRQRCEYADADRVRWAKEYADNDGAGSPWPYSKFIERLGEGMRLLHLAGPLISGALLVVSMFYGGAAAAATGEETNQAITVGFADAVWGQLERIPATFWGVVVGSFFTLLGIYFTNRAQASRQKVDLEHDRAERKSDREFAARKEIFVDAAGGLAGLAQCLARVSNVDVPFAQTIEESQSHRVSVARAYIIANDVTIQAMAKLSSGIDANLLKLSTMRHELDAAAQQLSDLAGKQRSHQEAAARVVESVRQINIQAGLAEPRANAARIMLEYEQQQQQIAGLERDETFLAARPKAIELIQATAAAGRELWPDIVAALAAIRAELGLETDQDKLLAIITESARRPFEEFDKIVGAMKDELERRKTADRERRKAQAAKASNPGKGKPA